MTEPRQAYRSEAQDAVRDVRHRAAVTAATELFADRGFHSASMADIARAAGLSLKAMYETFASKEALFTAVLSNVGDRFAVVYDDPHPGREAVPRLLAYVDRILAVLEENTAFLRLYQRGADGVPATLREGGIDPFGPATESLHRHLAVIVREAQAQGRAVGLDPDLVARALPTLVVSEARRALDAGRPITDAAAGVRTVFATLLA